ncbi:MAG: nucleotidyltransferase family protein, partial [Anaerolineae bacterium]
MNKPRKMIPENRILFAYTRQSFLDEHRELVLDVCSNTEIRWDVVYSTAQLHGVTPLVHSNLLQCPAENLGISQQIMNKFRLCYYRNTVTKEKSAERITRALSFFTERQIDVMLIKGAALDLLVYDHPWYTISDDIDLVIKCKREDMSDVD